MQDFKVGTEAIHHHGKQTEPQAIANFQNELHDLRVRMNGTDAEVSKNLAHFNYKKFDQDLHKPHNGAPAELDAHMHVAGVYKINGKMQMVFTDDLYKKSGDKAQHAYTVDEKTGKIDAVFDIAKNTKGEKVLVRHKENGESQDSLTHEKQGNTNVLRGDNNYTEYHTPDGRIIKSSGDLPTIHNPQQGPTEKFSREPFTGNIRYEIKNEQGKFEQRGGLYKSVDLTDDGTLTTTRTTGDFSTTTYPDGHSVDRNGPPESGNIVRVTEANGAQMRFDWANGLNESTPQSVRFDDPNLFLPDSSKVCEMQRVEGLTKQDVYRTENGLYFQISIDRTKGLVDKHEMTQDEVDQYKVHHSARGL